MLRTVITPNNRNVSIELPQSFVGKQVEVIAFTINDSINNSLVNDEPVTYYASEKSLAADWSTPEEDAAWANL